MNQNKTILTIVGVAILAGLAGFFGGTKYQQGKTPPKGQFTGTMGRNFDRNGTPGTQGINGGRQNGNGFRPVAGSILSMDDISITVKMNDGSSKIVLFSNSMTVNKTTAATKDDLKTGENVRVFGTTNSDGSITAQDIQLNPSMGGPGQGQPTPTDQPTQ